MEMVRGIAKETLEFILGASKNTAPNEFAGLLHEEDGVITDVLILPGTESSDRNAVIKLFMMPNVESVGSVHSHPGPSARPSEEDLRMFSKTGNLHIIVAEPYDKDSWVCYTREGQPVDLPVLDIELEEPEVI
ncbi:proteasome lid subunit RPN8/RPN11 [Methanohalophilus levihalophilus]|uniref:Mov34/MPN/PAD-1 family protein n=1 Tax=Methanohalophilus levihalophilus TaxID=1431282 RepID=UPI001AE89420|nr:Mov34/MPN/PAD-1 family protein [Methanohalophilus levihalophilus]MBP2029345.1 proteasome lid subunit RPN8/RPN11 [Methanohalophilus levihalophilus]